MCSQLVFNKEKFHEFAGECVDDCRYMADLFVTQSMQYVDELRECLTSDASLQWYETSHKFKGLAGFAGADRLYDICKDAQQEAHKPLPYRKNLFFQLEKEVLDVIDEIEKHFPERVRG